MKNTETDLEARMHAVMHESFPWLNRKSIKHQTHFSLKLGHVEVDVNGENKSSLSGRSDMLILINDKPMVLLELKREDVCIDDASDLNQALSYARLMIPMVPIVILSNGKVTKIYVTYNGEEWVPEGKTQMAFEACIANAGTLAASDVENAVNTLMGAHQSLWVEVFNSISNELVNERSGHWFEYKPFVRDFLILRQATKEIQSLLKSNNRVIGVAVENGKYSTLRKIAFL